jgi:peptidase M28-like protein
MIMKKIFLIGLLISITFFVFAQDINKIINPAEVERIEKILSADDMQGRATFTSAIDRAADFIQKEFKSTGLETPGNSGTYLQDFYLTKSKFIDAKATFDAQPVDKNNIVAFTSNPDLYINQDSGFIKAFIRAGDNFREQSSKYVQSEKNYLVLVDTSFTKDVKRMSSMKRAAFKTQRSTIFVLTTTDPKQYEVEIKHEVSKLKLANVVGILPGKSKSNEYVIFSGHYDHLGIGKPDEKGDSIYNGANDDASGTTAVIMLAKYFKQLDNNERTLVFVAFTAEEIGGYGSQYFSKQYDPAKVIAMFNIEMIGTDSKWGNNSAYITGYEKTDMGKILERNLQGSKFEFHADPYIPQNLFYRSDNATLARQGVPAHTISTSKMEEKPNDEPNYHKQSDEIGTLDIKNMSEIIKAIALSSSSIIAGKDTPTRVNADQLKK